MSHDTVSAPESLGEMIARVKDIIAGRRPPPVLPQVPSIVEFCHKEFAGYDPPPTPEAMRRMIDEASVIELYNDVPIACLATRDGSVVVLTSGETEVKALLRGLTDEERSRVIVDRPTDSVFPI